MRAGRVDDAIALYRLALSEWPDFPEVLVNLGGALLSLGDASGALTLFQRAVQIDPELAVAQSNLLLALLYSPELTPEDVYAAHRRWGLQFAEPATPVRRRRRDAGRLRIGYVSSNFQFNPEVFFLEPILRCHDRERFEVYCYAKVAVPDDFTHRFRRLADHWRNIHALSNAEAAVIIRRDRIDLLVDCPGHFSGGGLALFALKPAPVQISFPTYPATTGLAQIDYRITDHYADPDGMTDHLHTERLVRLRRVYCCYQPPDSAPAVNKLPALEQGVITFGAFNRPHKVCEVVIQLWARILREVQNSRLIFHHVFARGGGVPSALEERIAQQFNTHGVGPQRIEFVGALPIEQHMALFHRVDISLDTFPYNGMTTTCESLWMGVPVVVLAGQSHVSRVGVSLLNAVGVTDWVARSHQEYARIAIRMARDAAGLASLRAGLRSRMRRSPLTHSASFTRELERAYLRMWKEKRQAVK